MNRTNNEQHRHLFKLLSTELEAQKLFDDDYFLNQNFDVYTFPQTWGSTAMGFGGIGGASVTTATTTVIISRTRHYAAVFFGQKLAYEIIKPNAAFFVDLSNFRMADVRLHKNYIG